MGNTKLTVVIPAHNEEENIGRALELIEGNVRTPHEVVVVIDHCSDDTIGVVKRFIEMHPNVRWVENHLEGCFANAVKRGFEAADDGAVAVTMADLSDAPQTIDAMYERMEQGCDVVCGSRYMKGGVRNGGPLFQGIFSRFVGFTIHLLIGVPTRDISNAFKMYRKEVINNVKIEDRWFAMSMEMAIKAHFMGYVVSEVPTTWQGRVAGKSSFRMLRVGRGYLKLYLWALMMKVRTIFVPNQRPPKQRRSP